MKRLLLAAVLVVIGCSSPPPPGPEDAGATMPVSQDAGGTSPDAGMGMPDGGVFIADAGDIPDAGTAAPDGGVLVPDAGDAPDAGDGLDGGDALDAGAVPDAGAVDGGLPDAGDVDAGSDAGAGPQRPDGGAWYVDGGFTDSGVPVFVNVGDLPSLSAPTELPIAVSRAFHCNQAAVGASLPIADVAGAPGEALVIAPAGASPCTFHLAHRSDAGVDTPLSSSPGGFLLGAAASLGGVTMACVSDVVHQPAPGASPTAREVVEVPIRCWANAGAGWTLALDAVPGTSQAAAWVHSLEAVPNTSGAFTLSFVRDSTFQFLNLSDFGRPASDGLHAVPLSLGGNAVLAGAATQVSSSVHVGASTVTASVPTADDEAHLEGLADFDAGACAQGCLLDAGP